MTYYWQKLSKRFAIKFALPHLLLGVVAATFSLSDQNVLLTNAQQTSIITIASVMVNLHEHQADINVPAQYIKQHVQAFVKNNDFSPSFYVEPTQVIRLTPDNGIRAGPSSFLFV